MKNLNIIKKPTALFTVLASLILVIETYVALTIDDDTLHIFIFSIIFSVAYFVILLLASLTNKKIEFQLAINIISVIIFNTIIFLTGLDLGIILALIMIYLFFITLFNTVIKKVNNKFILFLTNIIHLVARVSITYLLLLGWVLGSMGV